MSYSLGMDALHLRATTRPAHTEYCDSEPLVRAVTGRDPRTDAGAWHAFHDAWDLDFLWRSNDGPVPWARRGRTTDMGHAEFMEGGSDYRLPTPSPFRSAEDVWAFDAVREYGLPDLDALASYYENCHRRDQAANPEQVCPGGYYKTVFSGAIEAFGWEMLLTAAADRRRFARVLDSIAALSRRHFEAWARTSAQVFICHDDMVWTSGPFVHPDFYRSSVFPHYRELWAILKRAGKRVLYCSDGDFGIFLDDLAEAGADGFIFEPMVDFDRVARDFGGTHVIVGSKVDVRTLTFGTPDAVRREVDSTLDAAGDLPGFIFAVGNHLPSNIPLQNCLAYMDHLRASWSR
jgi:hypothetical protein